MKFTSERSSPTWGCTTNVFVDAPPDSLNRIEKHYYRSVARAFNPYITTPNMFFDAQSVRNVYPRAQVEVASNIRALVAYAVQREFRDGFPKRPPLRVAAG